jgi:lysine 2,3-aminomutase
LLSSVVPSAISTTSGQVTTRESFISDVAAGMQRAPMATRLTPHILALIAWDKPYSDPIRRQFIPLASSLQPDHPRLQLDSLHESRDSPVKGLVHRYPDKVLFLGIFLLCAYMTAK